MNLSTNAILLCATAAGLFLIAPESALAQPYPRSVEIDGRTCIQQPGRTGEIETWCFTDDGQLRKTYVPPKPAPNVQTPPADFARYAPPTPAGGLSASSAEALSSAALKYSWSGPLKWSALTTGTFALVSLANEELRPAAVPFFVSAGLSLAIAIMLDASARDDTARAARQR